MALASTAQTITPKAQARVALVGLDTYERTTLRDGFKQFSIDSLMLSHEEAIEHINRHKLEACVLRLNDDAPSILSAIRTSKSNNRMVVYGICATAQEALSFSHFGINAIFNDPIERQNALKVVRATHLLVLHELRRYVRIPIVSPLELAADGDRYHGSIHEISGGGMSLETRANLSIGQGVEVTFKLPNTQDLCLRAAVAWIRPDVRLVGLRFDPQEPNRFRVKNWIDQYLDIG